MVGHLDRVTVDAARRWLAAAPTRDASPNGRYEVEARADAVVLSENGQAVDTVPVSGGRICDVAVSDDGQTIALLLDADKNQKSVALIERSPGQAAVQRTLIEGGYGFNGVDISADGQRIVLGSCYDVVTVDRAGQKSTQKLPTWVNDLQYMPDGRLLVQGQVDPWGTGQIPVYWVLDGTSRPSLVDNVAVVEALGPSVKGPLSKVYECTFPNATAGQRAALLDDFGYHSPTYRRPSPDGRRTVFSVEGKLDQGLPDTAGAWLFSSGGIARPVRLVDYQQGHPVVQDRRLSEVEWTPSGRRAALQFGSRDARLMVAEGDGSRWRALTWRIQREGEEVQHFEWSPDERYLAVTAIDGDRNIVYCWDTQEDKGYPVLPDATVTGWKRGRIEAELKDGRKLTVPPRPLDAEAGGLGLVLGGKPDPKRPPGQVTVEDGFVEVDGVRLPRTISEPFQVRRVI